MHMQERREQESRVFFTTLRTILVCQCRPPGERAAMADYSVVKDHSQHTIGVEFSSRTVKLGEKRIKLQVCSTYFVTRCRSDLT